LYKNDFLFIEEVYCTVRLDLNLIEVFNGSIVVGENEEFLKEGRHPVLLIESMGHALHAFVNQELQGYYLVHSFKE
jgi:hypothetical protein